MANHNRTKIRARQPRLFQAALLRWYEAHRRDLPWRPEMGSSEPVDPFEVLLSEFMLQQTQVATVIGYFTRFLKKFPTVAALAAGSEQDVLRLWQGLGYYSRARNLHAAARKIVSDFDGKVPADVAALLSLPGVGRYTAGAIASIAFALKAPILDGNVARVLCRLEKITTDPRDRKTVHRLWKLADDILPERNCGEFNSALMELGATICTPREPRCEICPVRRFCKAAKAGVQNVIPRPRKSRLTPISRRWTICVHHQARWLVERRSTTGRWAGLWQFPTIEADESVFNAKSAGKRIGLHIGHAREIGEIRRALTHRRYVFTVFVSGTKKAHRQPDGRRWIRLTDLEEIPMSRPQLMVAEMLRARKLRGAP